MPEVSLDGVTISYELFGAGDPVVLICGSGQPAVSWQLGMVPALTSAGYQVVAFDNRGVAPSSSPPAPYSIGAMVGDTIGLLDHLEMRSARLAGYSMGGWIAETLASEHPRRVKAAALIGSCNVGTSWEKAITSVELQLARRDLDLPRLFFAVETLRYLPNHELQDDAVVDEWLSLLGDLPPWPNPGREGQYAAALDWSNDIERTRSWSRIDVPCLVLAFEHDVDSPPAKARQAAAVIPAARFVEIPGASHLGPLTHPEAVSRALIQFFEETR